MIDLPKRLLAVLIAGGVPLVSQAQLPAYKAPPGVTFLLKDQAIGCYRGYSFSTPSSLNQVVEYYHQKARSAGLDRSDVQDRPGFYFSTYHNAAGFALGVAVNAQSKPTTATVMYRAGDGPVRC
jgi:hypothetical protein